MLRIDPNERVDVNDVVQYSEKMMNDLNKKQDSEKGNWRLLRMDPSLIMDDIIEKLHLLDYIKEFCLKKKRKPISRTYFAFSSPSEAADEKF